jgi:hypothetical protein
MKLLLITKKKQFKASTHDLKKSQHGDGRLHSQQHVMPTPFHQKPERNITGGKYLLQVRTEEYELLVLLAKPR